MESDNKPILVPWDFTDVAENALEHAVKFAKIIKHDIALLHVLKKKKDEPEMVEKLQKLSIANEKDHQVKTIAMVREGNIFNTIKDVAKEIEATLCVMGTHGIKGMQKFTGSWALKVIVGSTTPFVVVQGSPNAEEIKDIVFPVEFKFQDKEKLRWANYFSKFYHTKIQICTPNVTDLTIKKKTEANVIFAKKYLEMKEIDYAITTLEGKDFAIETIEFAEKIKASLILIMTTPNISFTDYAFGANEQKIIANDAKIPVMCVNPREDLLKAIDSKTGGNW